jgi:hypothetical protein
MTVKGRHWFLLWLLLFLGTAAAVVARQGDALRTARRLGELRERRVALEGAREELRRQIRAASSRGVLVPLMERAGFHTPADSENTIVSVDTLAAGAGRRR